MSRTIRFNLADILQEMGIKKSVEGKECPADGAMAMKMKPLIMNLLLVLTVAMRMPLSLADPYTNIVSQYCGNERQYENGSAFQRNLNELLERLVRDAYNNAFDFSSVADMGFNSAVYGLVQCTQDLGPYDRQRCASTAKRRLLQGCSGTYGYIQLSGCLLRYDNHYFYHESRERQGTSTAEVWSYCGKTQSRNDIDFRQSLNKVLESLVENANPTGFNTSNVAEGANSNSAAVYGIVQCRGDLGSFACKQCASTAKEILVEKCYNTSGVIHLDGCFLRYGNNDTYNYVENMQITPTEVLCNSGTSSQPQQFQKTAQVLLSNIITEALRSPKLFATNLVGAPSNLTGHIYGLAQCWGHLSQTNCRSCLTSALEYIFLCQNGAPGAQISRDRCHLRYEAFEFFNTSVPSWTPQGESPPLPESKNGSNISPRKNPAASKGKILGITLGVIAAVIGLTATIGLLMWYFSCRPKSRDQISGTKEVILSPNVINSELIFKYEILREGTSNFKMENKLGEGGFGCVFKGVLPNGEEVAVKRLKVGSKQGEAEFLNETNLISRVQHRNLVKLLGCSVENSERLLVYEYLPIGSLDKLLFDTTKRHLLDWKERYKIIVGTARGLAYLHEESEIRIIHRDIKASNILLDHKHTPKIADFGLARLFAEDESHVSTRVVGTIGYMAPEYALRGQLTEKADVFSFGVLLLEIISGRKNQSSAKDDFLIERTWKLYKEQRALEIMDPTLEGSYSWEEGIRVIKIGLLCTQAAVALRPSMSRVVWMLTSDGEHLLSPTKPAFIEVESVEEPDLTRPDVHSVAAAPPYSVLEPR